MRKTEMAKQLDSERKAEKQKQARQRRRELSTPSTGELLRREAQLEDRKARLKRAQQALQETKALLGVE